MSELSPAAPLFDLAMELAAAGLACQVVAFAWCLAMDWWDRWRFPQVVQPYPRTPTPSLRSDTSPPASLQRYGGRASRAGWER